MKTLTNLLESNIKQKKLNCVETWKIDSSKFKTVNEENSDFVVDGKAILGIIEGPMFVPDGDSRNGRHYTKEFWNKIINSDDVQNRLKKGLMGGQIGHKDTPVSDEDWNKGEVSHKVVKLWITENNEGWGRIIIFGTPAGQNLKIYFDSKTELYTSSRASGDYKTGVRINNLPVVDDEGFYLDTFDFVKDPGFLQAQPSLVENYFYNGGNSMEELLKKLQESIDTLSAKLSGANNTSESVVNEKNALTEQIKAIKESTKFLENIDKSVLESLKELTPVDFTNLLKRVSVIGEARLVNYTHESLSYEGVFIPTKLSNIPLDKVHNALSNENLKENYPSVVLSISKKENNTLGSNGLLMLWNNNKRPATVLETVKTLMNQNTNVFEGFGINETNSELKAYKSLGTPEEIKEALENMDQHLPVYKEYLKLGEADTLKELMSETEALNKELSKLGPNLPTIKKAFQEASKIIGECTNVVQKQTKESLDNKALKLSQKYELPLESVKKALVSMGESEANKFLKSLSKVENTPNKGDNKNKDSKQIKTESKTRSGRIFETVYGGGKK